MKEVEIKDISGKVRFSTPINKGAKGKFTLMKEDYIILPFSVAKPVAFKMGDYVDLSEVLDESLGGKLSKIYEIVDLQKPTYNSSTGGYDYELKLDAYYWKWKNKIFKYTPENAGSEASWTLTAGLDVQLGVFLRNLKALGYTYKGKDYVFEIGSTVENKAVAMTYDNINLLDALFSMASEDKWNCDCWVEENVIHFGRCEFGDAVKIERDIEASSITRSESQGTYATRIYAFGGTRNIPNNYGKKFIDSVSFIQGDVRFTGLLHNTNYYLDDGADVQVCFLTGSEENKVFPVHWTAGNFYFEDGTICKAVVGDRFELLNFPDNVPDKYLSLSTEDLIVNGVVQKRLMMPADTPYIDVYPDMSQEEAIESIVVFDDIYPKRVGTMSDVNTVPRDIKEDDKVVGTFDAYQYKDVDFVFDKKYQIEGTELKITFQSGKMNGMEFGVIFDPNDKDEQLWEIVRNEDYGRPLPDEYIHPENGDQYVLSGFNIKLVSDQYIPSAEQELKERAQKYADKTKIDDGTYPVTLRSDWVKENLILRTFSFGQRINLVDDTFFENGRISRVLGWEMNLDIPWDSPVYTIGESMPYSRIGELEEKVDSLIYNGQTYNGNYGGGGSYVYVIKTNDSTSPTDSNVFSALRSLATFLRKDKADSTNHLLTLLAGAVFGTNKAEITAEGVAKFLSMVISGGKASIDTEGLLTAVNAIIKGDVKSDNFLAGALGSGYALLKKDADGKSYLEVDKIFARVKAIFAVLEIMKVTYTGGNFVFSPAGMQCTKVEEYESFYRCFFTADDGEKAVENTFEVDDFVQLREFNVKPGIYENVSNRYFWRRCIAKGDDYIDLSKADRDMTSNDAPMVGDSLVTIGNKTIKSRQNVIIISVYGEGSPSIIQYAGVNDYSLDGKAVTVISPSGNKFTGSFVIESSSKNIEDELSDINDKIEKVKLKSVLAEYSSDKVNWHPSFVEGDVWMRTSSDNGTTWGEAIRIVGIKGEDGTSVKILGEKGSADELPSSGNENGDGYIVDGDLYVWNGSSWTNVGKIQGPAGQDGKDGSYTVIEFARNTSLTEAPADGWSSIPPSSQSGYYIWMRTGTVTPPSTTPVWNTPVRQTGEAGTDGQNVYRLDLSNEVDGVPCDSEGTPTGKLPSTSIYVYNGGTLDSGWTFKATYNGCSGSIANSTLTVTAITADRATATITATKSGRPTLNATMSIYKVKAGQDGTDGTNGKDAVVYSIKPSATSVIKSSTDVLTPNSVTCAKYKTVGNGTATVTTEKTLKYQRLGVDSAEVAYSGAVTITDTTKSVVFSLYDGSTLLDRENVPVLSDASDLVIGGRNLMLNSDKAISFSGSGISTVNIAEDLSAYSGKYMTLGFDYEYSNVTTGDSFNKSRIGFEFTLKRNDGSTYYWGVFLNIPFNSKGISDKGRFTKTLLLPEGIKSTTYKAVYAQILSGDVTISRYKLEQGNKATDWSPAPEDVESSISEAQKAAEDAQAAAEQAQKDADAANAELSTIASDNYITPSEKTALKQQQADIQSERGEIIANATKYGVSYTAYDAAYTAANNALTKYTASSPKNIEVGSDYANISAYYAARKTILDAIATAAKKVVDDLNNDLQGYKTEVTQKFEAVDGRFTSVINETKEYTDTVASGLSARIEENATKIEQNSNEIALKASQSSVDNLSGRVSSAEATLTVQAGQIASKASQTSVDTLTGRVTTAESRIEQNAESISLKVSKKEFDALQVGGRNLARETSSDWCTELTLTNGTNQCLGGFSNKIYLDTLKVGDEVVISFDYKWENFIYGNNWNVWVQGEGNVTGWESGLFPTVPLKGAISGESGEVHISVVRTITANHLKNQYWNPDIRHDYLKGTVSIRNFKVEKGNKATTWSPAPEDYTNALNGSIGGMNLIDNSSFQKDLKGWSTNGASGTFTAAVVNDSAAGKCLQLWFSTNYCGVFRALTEQGKAYARAGEMFTISFDLYKKASVPAKIAVGFEDDGVDADNTIDISKVELNKWTRLSITQTLKTSRANIIIYGLGTGGATIYVKNLMVERGNIATPWMASENERLLDTGIDILNRKMIFTADNTLIQDNTGKQIAMFTTKNGKPLLAAENIDVDNLKVKYLQGATGTFKGVLEAASGSFNGELVVSLLRTRLYTIPGGKSSVEIRPDVDQCCNYYFHENHFSSGGKYPSTVNVLLPEADFYEGLEISFFRMVTNSTSPYTPIVSTFGYIYILSPYENDPSVNFITKAESAVISANKRVVFKAMDGKWFNVEGNCLPKT